MPVFKDRGVISSIPVKEAMRRQVNRLSDDVTIAVCIRRMIKLKINAVLVDNASGHPVGVVSKTDILGAYYAGLPVESRLEDIVAGPPQFCYPDARLEDVLDQMHQSGIHQVFVHGAESSEVSGILAYSDIVGLLYRYCRICPKSSRKGGGTDDDLSRLEVNDVMTPSTVACLTNDAISDVIETISSQRLGAVLIRDDHHRPAGTISKTDLVLSFVHGTATTAPATEIMSSPVVTANSSDLLVSAIQKMLLRAVQRLFITAANSDDIIGVLSLSDAARFRSGTCRACTTSRMVEGIKK